MKTLRCLVLLAALWVCLPAAAFAVTGNIHSTHKWAWSEAVGWINFGPADGGVTVLPDHLEGRAWGENIGWIDLGATGYAGSGGADYYPNTAPNSGFPDWGVNRSGSQLSGYAWSAAAGWINFNPTNAPAPGGVTIDGNGTFHGYAWAENLGWVSFNGADRTPADPYYVATVSLTGLSILGPNQLVAGGSAYYRAYANFDDGSTALVQPDAWSVTACSTTPCPASVDAAGMVQVSGVAGDSFTLQADYTFGGASVIATLNITVVSSPAVGHFETLQPVETTPVSAVYFGHVSILTVDAEAGDEVGVYDPRGKLVGVAPVSTGGIYGPLVVYGDDPATAGTIEGAQAGEPLTFMVWDTTPGREIRPLTSPRPVNWAANDAQAVDLDWGNALTIPLQAGWNLISIPLAVDWYAGTQPAAADLPALPGGQLFSHQAVTSVGDVFTDINGQYDQVVTRRGGTYYSYSPSAANPAGLVGPQVLDFIAGGYGYFIHMTAAGTLNFTADLQPLDPGAVLTVPAGLNLVGYWGQDVRVTSGSEAQATAAYPAAGGFLPVPAVSSLASLGDGIQVLDAALPAVPTPIPFWMRGWNGTDFQGFDSSYPEPATLNTLKFVGPGRGYLMNVGTDALLEYGE